MEISGHSVKTESGNILYVIELWSGNSLVEYIESYDGHNLYIER